MSGRTLVLEPVRAPLRTPGEVRVSDGNGDYYTITSAELENAIAAYRQATGPNAPHRYQGPPPGYRSTYGAMGPLPCFRRGCERMPSHHLHV
jgi:hypothetical protein